MNIFRPLYDKSFLHNERIIFIGINSSQYTAIKKKLEINRRINNITLSNYKITFEIAGTIKELSSEHILEKYVRNEPDSTLPISSGNRKYYYVPKTRINQFNRICNEILKSDLVLIGYVICKVDENRQ